MHLHIHEIQSVPNVRRRLKLTAAATFALVIFEVIAGTVSHSLSLYSDAAQNLVDGLGLMLLWWGAWLSVRPADSRRTFGYGRVTVLFALLNAILLMPIIYEIGEQAIMRFLHPVAIDGTVVGITGAVGLVVNIGVALALRSNSNKLHVRGAYLHNLADAASCLLIIVSGVLISFTGATWLDLVLSAGICTALIVAMVPIVRTSVHILLEGAPDDANPDEIRLALLDFPEVVDVHDLHAWLQGDGMPAVTGHVVVNNALPHEQDHQLLDNLREMLRDRFSITHTTIQLEHENCEQSKRCLWAEHDHAH